MSTPHHVALLLSLSLGLCQAQVEKAAALAFGEQIERAIEAKQGVRFLADSFDSAALAARTIEGLDPQVEERAKIQASVQQAIPSLAKALRGRNNSFHLVTFVAEGSPRLIFRRVEPESFALSYVTLHLELRSGALRIVDAAHGDVPWSEKMRRQFRAYLSGAKPSPAYEQIAQLWPLRKAAETLAAIGRLPEGEAQQLDMLVIAANANALLGNAPAWEAALRKLREAFPESIEAKVSAIEYHDHLEDYPAALGAVDVLAAQIDDPFLDFRRALIHSAAGDEEAARAAMQRALERDPRLRLEDEAPPAPPQPVSDPREAARIYLGVSGGALPASELDRIFDWPAVLAATAAKLPDVKGMTPEQFRSLSLESYGNRPQRIDAAGLEKLVANLTVEVEGPVATVSGKPLRAPVHFHKVEAGWYYRGGE